MLSGPGGDARANAISRLATSSVGAEPAAWPLLWRKRRNHGSWPISAGKGQGYGTHQPESQPAIFTGCATPVAWRPASPLVDPQVILYVGKRMPRS